jgi:hypothetical protein
MDRPEQRPRFDFEVSLPPDQVSELLRVGLETCECPCVGSVAKRHAWIHISDEERHFWSPTLDLSLEEVEDGTVLRGRFGPHPSVWTMFIFIYAALGVGSFLSAMYGVAQLTLDRPPWAFGASAGLAALIGFVYGAAFIGQGLGSEQIVQIRLFLDRAVGRVDLGASAPLPDAPHVDSIANAQG